MHGLFCEISIFLSRNVLHAFLIFPQKPVEVNTIPFSVNVRISQKHPCCPVI